MPDTGGLIVRGMPRTGAGADPRLIFDALTADTDHFGEWLNVSADNEPVADLPILLAGRDRVSLVCRNSDTGADQQLRGPVEVEVRAGQKTLVGLP